jgi:hypothetical protein
MRLNAFISASVAIALLSSGHMSLAASSHSAHRTVAHKTAQVSTPAAKKRTNKKTASGRSTMTHSTRNGAKKRRATVEQVHAPSRKGRRQSADMLQAASAQDARLMGVGRKATPDDFMRAAAGISGTAASQLQPGAQLSAAGASDLHGSSEISVASVATGNPAKPVSAVGVTRAASPKPHLDTVEDEAVNPVILPTLYNKRGRLIVPPPLRGSHEILVRQNVVADRDGLDRIQDDDDLSRMRIQRLLVPIPVSSALDVDDRLPANRRYARPWTAQFLATLARAHYARFHTPLQVNSAVRTVEFQQRLQRTNGNAAPAEGETASPHLTGQAIDLAKHGLSITEIAWLRGYLLPLSQQGRIDVEEEFQQSCFHISVYKKYSPSTPKREIASSSRVGTTALAAAIN